MALKNQIDTEAAAKRLGSWWQAKVPAAQGVEVIDVHVPPSGGLSNETVLFTAVWEQNGEHRSQRMVARVQPDGPGVFPTYDLSKEARVLSALGAHTDVPVPAVHFFEEDSAVFGSPFLVMQRVDGRVPADDPPFTAGGWVLDLTADERARLWDNSIAAIAAIHHVDWGELGLEFLDTVANGSGVPAQLSWCRDTFEWATEGRPNQTIDAALQWLEANIPVNTGSKVLNWGDARVGNIIVADDLTVAAILDWEMVTVGRPEQDLGWWLFLVRHHTEGIGLPLPEGIPDRATTLARYEAITGHRVQDVDYFEVLAGVKLSIIMVRAANMMIAAGLLPPDSPMALSNPASQLLAKLLGLPAPTGDTTSFIGNR